MSPENSAQPDPVSAIDEPLDAVVYEEHPAVAAGIRYPYGPPSAPLAPVAEVAERLMSASILQFESARPADYMVPKRFGMSAILGITTALAILFGVLRWLDAFPVMYLFFGVQAIVICVVQMFNGSQPRVASALAGCILLPVFIVFGAAIHDDGEVAVAFFLAILSAPFGGFLGYLTGTCAAGVFLLMDKAETWLKGEESEQVPSGGSPA